MRELATLVLTLLAATACGDVVNPQTDDATDAIDAATDVDAEPLPDAPDDGGGDPDAEEPPPPVAVTVALAGAGAGTVESDPTGVTCPGTCTASYSPGTAVTLTATPAAGALFTGWSGACSGTAATCSFVADADTTATATFAVATYTVSVSKSGAGSGSISGSGVACGATCEVVVPHGTMITLAATPDGGAVFAGWGGACSGTGACSVTVTEDIAISAGFTTQSFTLLVARGGNGAGTVTSAPAGIACGTDCDETYTNGAQVTLTATPSAGSTFAGWSGSGCTGTSTCVVTIGATNVVTATFTLARYALTVTPAGTGEGRVTSTPAGLSCGTTCTAQFDHGTLVALAASPAVGSTFAGWTGACTGTGACNVPMTAARSVGASFTAVAPNIIFVTSAAHTAASLGSVAGADLICQAQAQAAGLVGTGAGQNSSFRAWLSSSTSSAASRIGTSRGWVRPDGKPVMDTYADIAEHQVYYPPRMTAAGVLIAADERLISNTRPDGTYYGTGPACTSTAGAEYAGSGGDTVVRGGNVSAVSSMLVAFTSTGCTSARRLLCLGIGRTARVTPAPTTGRLAFTTKASFLVGGGIAAADALCTSEASAARLPGTYKALMATNGQSAISRFDTRGLPWVRAADRIPLAATAALLASTSRFTALDTAPNLSADGTVRVGNTGIWTGAANFVTAGTTATTCNNWSTSGGTGRTGRAGDTAVDTFFGHDENQPCDATYRKVVCFQE